MRNLEKFKADLAELIKRGKAIEIWMELEIRKKETEADGLEYKYPKGIKDIKHVYNLYEPWYSEALAMIRQMLPDRAADFAALYKPQRARKELTAESYTISDYLRGLTTSRGTQVLTPLRSASLPLRQQVSMLEGLETRFESSLFDIAVIVQADLLDDELHAASELNSKGFQRGAGAIAGVVLEAHLSAICERHNVTLKSKQSTITPLNDALHNAKVIETSVWRSIQHLGDLRNKCDHKLQADPSKDEVEDLITGVRKISKTVY